MPGHVELFVQHHSQVPVLVLGIALTQLQDLALGFVELQAVYMGSALEPVPLNDLPHIRNISQYNCAPDWVRHSALCRNVLQ